MKEYAKLRVESNRDMLIFWAVLFFTCVVGIIELLPEIRELTFPLRGISLITIFASNQTYVTCIYFGLLSGMVFSIINAFNVYRNSFDLVQKDELGADGKKSVKDYPTYIDRLMFLKGDKIAESCLISLIFLFFVLLYFSRIGLLKYIFGMN